MSNKARNTSGKFAAKSETPRKIRSVNLTDDAWQWLADVAAQAGVSRNDFIEAMAEGSTPFMETVNSEASPLMEAVESDSAEITEQPQDNISPFIETANSEVESLKQQLEEVKADRDKVFENSLTLKTKLERQVVELRSQLATERADREEIEAELEDLQQKSAPASKLDKGHLLHSLSRFLKKYPKSNLIFPQMKALLEMIEASQDETSQEN